MSEKMVRVKNLTNFTSVDNIHFRGGESSLPLERARELQGYGVVEILEDEEEQLYRLAKKLKLDKDHEKFAAFAARLGHELDTGDE